MLNKMFVLEWVACQGDIQKHTRVLRARDARGCSAPPKKLICLDESSNEDESERKSDYVRG